MGYYKFLHSVHLDNILRDGTLRVSSLSYYRRLEDRQWIADRLEGSVEVRLTQGLAVTGNEVSEFTPPGYNPQVVAGSGGKIVLGEQVILNFQHPEVFVFCLSQGDLSELTEVMCQHGDRPYDACIQVNDIQLLGHRMYYSGKILEMNGVKVNELFTSGRWAPVEYKDLSLDQKNIRCRPEPPSPFVKHNDPFPVQREVRIALFEPRRTLPAETLTIKIPRPEQIFTEVFRNRSERSRCILPKVGLGQER
jgi:hypothetical protein